MQNPQWAPGCLSHMRTSSGCEEDEARRPQADRNQLQVPQCSLHSRLPLCGLLFSFNFLKVPKFNQTGEDSHPTMKLLVLYTFHTRWGKDGPEIPSLLQPDSQGPGSNGQIQEVREEGAQPTGEDQQGRSVSDLTKREQAKTRSSARTQLRGIWPNTLWTKKGLHPEPDQLRGGLHGGPHTLRDGK